MTIYTTLNKILAHNPCKGGWKKLLRNLGNTKEDDEPLKFSKILESNGIDDALWCLRSICPEYGREVRLFSAECADRVVHLFEKQYPNDDRPRKAIKAARDFAHGLITEEARAAAEAAARSAAEAAAEAAARSAAEAAAWDAAWAAARDAARSAAEAAARDAAWDAARDAARSAARAAARAAAWDAARAAARDAAEAAAWDAAWAAARDAELELQSEMLVKYFG